MSKQSEYMRGRNEGLAFALKIAKEKGVEGLEAEINYRGTAGVSLNVSKDELEKASAKYKEHAMKFSILVSLVTLYDDFSFSNYQGREFNDRYYERVNRLVEGKVTAAEYVKYCKDNIGIAIDLRD